MDQFAPSVKPPNSQAFCPSICSAFEQSPGAMYSSACSQLRSTTTYAPRSATNVRSLTRAAYLHRNTRCQSRLSGHGRQFQREPRPLLLSLRSNTGANSGPIQLTSPMKTMLLVAALVCTFAISALFSPELSVTIASGSFAMGLIWIARRDYTRKPRFRLRRFRPSCRKPESPPNSSNADAGCNWTYTTCSTQSASEIALSDAIRDIHNRESPAVSQLLAP
jgi:hypothetical protein